MKVVARRREGFAHEVEIEGGHTVLVDEPVDSGGADTGPSPTRLLAASLASCVAITIEMYAERKGWNLGRVEVDVEAEYEGYAPSSFEVTLRLPPELSDEQRERLVAIAGKCPVHKVLAQETPVIVSERVEAL
ncbi:MAG TPA: OsmC family protein [Solirubrobacterales bacterium]|jgi:putative redox protein